MKHDTCYLRRLFRPFGLLLIVGLTLLGSLPPVAAANEATPVTLPFRVRDTISARSIDSVTVGTAILTITGATRIVETSGAAEVGAYVEASGQVDAAGRAIALELVVLRAAGAPGEIIEFSGIVSSIKYRTDAITGVVTQFWFVDKQLVSATLPETAIIGDPRVGWLVWVVGVRKYDEVKALAIEGIADSPSALPVEFEGSLERITSDAWYVDSLRIAIGPKTLVLGLPIVGGPVEVRARQEPSGALTGLVLRAVDATTEAYVNALIDEIVRHEDGSQTWKVTMFAEVNGNLQIVPGTVQIDAATYVEERRAVLSRGVYAEIDGQALAATDIKADLARLDRPTPVTRQGQLVTEPSAPGGQLWRIGGERVWTNVPQVEQALQAAAFGAVGNTTVRGVRLGNGLIWAQQVTTSPEYMQ